MKTLITLTAVVCLLGSTALAHAAKTLASAAIYGASTQDQAGCFIGNEGTTPIGVDLRIFDESGNALTSGSSCGGVVQPGFICSVFVNISSGVAYACSATATGSTKKLRGSLVLFDAGVPLRSTDLR